MDIVANSFFLRNLRNLDFFTLNLGKTKKLVGATDKKDSFRKLSEFEIKYNNLYNRGIMMFGNIGKITFYEDVLMSGHKYLIFNNDDIYEIEWTEEDISDIKNYILDTMRRIDEIDNEDEDDSVHGSIDNFNNTWEAKDEKNRGKKYLVNQNLSREEYTKELLKIFESQNI
jgi:hypothetical protein